MPNRAQIDDGDITSFEVGGIHPHELKMDQERSSRAFSWPAKALLPLCTQWPRLNLISPANHRT